jgi:hypothetical protein
MSDDLFVADHGQSLICLSEDTGEFHPVNDKLAPGATRSGIGGGSAGEGSGGRALAIFLWWWTISVLLLIQKGIGRSVGLRGGRVARE